MVKMSANWKQKTRTIRDDAWDPRETVTIRTFFGSDDRQRVLSATHEGIRQDDGSVVMRPTTYRAKAVQRTLAVVSWTLLDEDGAPLPFTEETLLNLPPEVSDFIDAEIDKDWLGLSSIPTPEQAQEAKEERSTFRGTGLSAAGGREPDGRADDAARAADPGPNGTDAPHAPPVEGVPPGALPPGGVPGALA